MRLPVQFSRSYAGCAFGYLGDMVKAKIDSCFWSDPDIEVLTSDQKLCFLWILTNSQVNLCGCCQVSERRFAFETGLKPEVFKSTIEALPRALKFFNSHSMVYIRNYIRRQLGDGEQLERNNIFKGVISAFKGLPLPVQESIISDYLVIGRACEGLVKGLNGTPKGKEKEKEKEQEKEKALKGEYEGKTETGLIDKARVALLYLNEKAGRSFRETVDSLKIIDQRISEVNGDLDGVKLMIDRKVIQWKGDPKMEEFLRPATLFAKSNFHSYYDDRNTPVFLPTITPRKEISDERHSQGF